MTDFTPATLREMAEAATPGPWSAHDETGPRTKWGTKGNIGIWADARYQHALAAYDEDEDGDPEDDAWVAGIWGEISQEDHANARLIAAAPDLALALADALEQRDKLVEALREATKIVHMAFVAATREAVNAGRSHPLGRNFDAWRVRCARAEDQARAALALVEGGK